VSTLQTIDTDTLTHWCCLVCSSLLHSRYKVQKSDGIARSAAQASSSAAQVLHHDSADHVSHMRESGLYSAPSSVEEDLRESCRPGECSHDAFARFAAAGEPLPSMATFNRAAKSTCRYFGGSDGAELAHGSRSLATAGDCETCGSARPVTSTWRAEVASSPLWCDDFDWTSTEEHSCVRRSGIRAGPQATSLSPS
jgi:hypothetical protein